MHHQLILSYPYHDPIFNVFIGKHICIETSYIVQIITTSTVGNHQHNREIMTLEDLPIASKKLHQELTFNLQQPSNNVLKYSIT